MNTSLTRWKEAATVILAAGHRLRSSFDYDVLLLKRSSKSGFLPNAYVFPGGLLDSSDFSNEWLDVFSSFTNFPHFGLGRVKQPVETRPPVFATDRLKLGSRVPGEVAFRICALRETFEESGVLLVVSKAEETSLLQSMKEGCVSDHVARARLCGSSELTKWKALVNENPFNFLRMCRELQLLPNIWALHEWSNWLTPSSRSGRRFDTAFFMCCLREIPYTSQDEKEIVHIKWATPSEILHRFRAQELWIAPPQFYELSRLCHFPLLKDLHSFSGQRATEGCERWHPVIVKDTHVFSLLPGDKHYPQGGSEETVADRGVRHAEDHHGEDSSLHRIMILDSYTLTVQVTITPKYKHLLPVAEPMFPMNGQL
ncbi:nucleoside diphosphate-linked moiety X motif 19 [Thalassophryne amazonica]|uniref:nucleoside diphosphate-linked moiety X motif 19 n=1 Tax=Thalassophryne amazonica TaxID=390379 RepID=UPI001471C958|nr:nucleoside diphosphate-linked moiety X motif 19 [Thalassophryne amazonica]